MHDIVTCRSVTLISTSTNREACGIKGKRSIIDAMSLDSSPTFDARNSMIFSVSVNLYSFDSREVNEECDEWRAI